MRTRLKPGTIKRSRVLRAQATEAERLLWYRLREMKPLGFHFRRQAPFRSYFLDFVEHSFRLVVELDGGQHADQKNQIHDRIRDETLRAEGYRILRFWNIDVVGNVDNVVDFIVEELKSRCRPPTRTAPLSDLPTKGR